MKPDQLSEIQQRLKINRIILKEQLYVTDVSDLLAHISELLEKIEQLKAENQLLRVALQDAIRKPMGVIPDSAVPFTL